MSSPIKSQDFPKSGLSYHTYSLTSLGGRRGHPGEGCQGTGRLGQQAVTTRWASMKLEGGSQNQQGKSQGLHTVPQNGEELEWVGPISSWGNFVKFCTLSFHHKQGGEREAEGSSYGKWPSRGPPVPALSAVESQARAPTTAVGTRALSKRAPWCLLCSLQKKTREKSSKCLNLPK